MSLQATSRRKQAFEAFATALQDELQESLTEIILYGSTARGEATEHSDVDILLVMDEPPDREQRDSIFGAAFEIGLDYGVEIIPNLYSQATFEERREYPFLTTVRREGQTYG